MPIIFDNTGDLTNVSVPSFTVGVPRLVQLVSGERVNLYRDGVLVHRFTQRYEEYLARGEGLYTFNIPLRDCQEICAKPVAIDVTDMPGQAGAINTIATVPCGGADPGAYTKGDTSTLIDGIIDWYPTNTIVPNAALDGTGFQVPPGPFTGFPADYLAPFDGQHSQFGLSWGNSDTAPPVSCADVMVDRAYFTFTYTQTVDLDPLPPTTDFADLFLAISVDGQTTVDSTGTLISGGGAIAPQILTSAGVPNDTTRYTPVNNVSSTIEVDLDNPGNYTLAEVCAMRLDSVFQIGNGVTIEDVRLDVEYTVGPNCSPQALVVEDCNSAAQLAALNSIAAAVGGATNTFTVDPGVWVSNSGSGTWTKEVIPYIDGVAQAPIVVDSGIATTEPAPNEVDYVVVEKDACNAAGTWTVGNVFTTLDLVNPVAQIFVNPTGVVATDPGDLAACADDPDCSEVCIGRFCYDTNPGVGSAYGVKDCATDAVEFRDVTTNAIVPVADIIDCPPETVEIADVVDVPGGRVISNAGVVDQLVTALGVPAIVRTLHIRKESDSTVVASINFDGGGLSTNVIDMRNAGTLTLGNGDGASMLDVSNVAITAPAGARMYVTFEV